MKKTSRLKSLIAAPGILMLPGVHDALTARIAEQVGFDALVVGGFAATGVLLGEPDTAQLTMVEMAQFCGRVSDAVEIPILADADTGFGNSTNVRRTVREYEKAGVSGLFIEDQVFPKRCGHMDGKDVVPREEILAKLQAALEARTDPDFVIVGRTDALAVHGIDEAIGRGRLYRELGVDLIFVEAAGSVDEMRRICGEVGGPQLANMVEFGKTPEVTARELEELGYAVGVWPVSSVLAATRSMFELMTTLKKDGTTEAVKDRMMTFEAYCDLVGLPGLRRSESEAMKSAQEILGGFKESPATGD